MKRATQTNETENRSLNQKIVKGIAIGLLSILPLYILLMSGFIIFVPLIIFLVWLSQRYRKNDLRAQWKLGAALFAVSITASGLMFWAMFRDTRQPDRYLIPQGYVGWVIVEYNVKGAPPLPIEDGHLLHRIARDGRMQTSSSLEDGWASDDYFYITPTGRRQLENTGWGEGGLIWGGSTSDGSIGVSNGNGMKTIQTPPTQTFFVGTEQQFRHAGAEPHSKQMEKIIEAT